MFRKPLSFTRSVARLCVVAAALSSTAALAVPVTFTKLTGLAGGSPAGTAIYRADLSGVGIASIQSISVFDNSGGLGGATGQFSGFDLDAISLSTSSCADAACAAGLSGLAGFDFGSGTLFSAGAQRIPVDPKLFGTDATGAALDNAIATLAAFDASNSTVTPGGFISLGDNGSITFNLTSAISTTGLFLYIGEVGDNGEVAAGQVIVRENRVAPEPGSIALVLLAVLAAVITPRTARTRRV
jgi:hypothetical protein